MAGPHHVHRLEEDCGPRPVHPASCTARHREGLSPSGTIERLGDEHLRPHPISVSFKYLDHLHCVSLAQ
jgi:hypothetical protein